MSEKRDRSSGEQPLAKYLRVSGVLTPDNRLMLRPSYLTDSGRGARDIEDSPIQILLFAGEKLLMRWGAFIGVYQHAGGGAPGDERKGHTEPVDTSFRPVRAKVPFPPKTDRIVFRLGDVELAEIAVPDKVPDIKKLDVTQGKDTWQIAWTAKHPDGLPLHYHVRASADGGRTWGRLGSRLLTNQIIVPVCDLAGGKDCIVQVVCYDGVNTVTREIRVPEAPPVSLQVSIVYPQVRKEPYKPPIVLEAVGRIPGRSDTLGRLADWIWLANGKEIATGPSALWYDAEPGRYEIVLLARSGDLEARAETKVQVAKRD